MSVRREHLHEIWKVGAIPQRTSLPGIAAGERGSILLLVALLMGALLGCAGLAVDVRNGYVVRAMLQHAVDDGALSARRWGVQIDDGPGASPAAIASGAAVEAMQVVRRDLAAQGIEAISSPSVTLGAGRLLVAARARVPTFFLGLFGIPFWVPRAQAEAPLWDIPAGPSVGGAGGAGGGAAGMPPQGVPAVEGGDRGDRRAGAGATQPSGSAGPQAQTDVQAPGQADAMGPCNCDAIAAGDPQAARDALERMGITPGAPGPFQGDLTSAMGFGAMQSGPGGDAPPDEGPVLDDGDW